MSTEPTGRIYDPSVPGWDAPNWLSLFVRDELRPYLISA
jgi:hypothetical protein